VKWVDHHMVEMEHGLMKIPLCEDEYQVWLAGGDPLGHVHEQEQRVREEDRVPDEAGCVELGDAEDEETWGDEE
jgi:hypothetical protein